MVWIARHATFGLTSSALFYGRRWSPWPLPKTRAEWIELMKPDAELAMSLVSLSFFNYEVAAAAVASVS